MPAVCMFVKKVHEIGTLTDNKSVRRVCSAPKPGNFRELHRHDIDKCIILYVGKKNPRHPYCMGNVKFSNRYIFVS